MQIGSRTRDVKLEHIVRMLRITAWEKSFNVVNISWWILNLKERDTKYSITQWKLSTRQSWTRNLIIFSKNWKVQQKWNWLFVSFWKIHKMEGSVTFTHTKKTPRWIDPNLCAPMTTCQSWKIFSTKLTSSRLVAEKKWTQSGGSTK